jgi:ethanolamine ammonia-lyase large subunit
MGVPCADDVMLNYQSTSYHDAAAVRRIFGLQPAPEFLVWLQERGIFAEKQLAPGDTRPQGRLLEDLRAALEWSTGNRL